jgi:hypothetical protein
VLALLAALVLPWLQHRLSFLGRLTSKAGTIYSNKGIRSRSTNSSPALHYQLIHMVMVA